MLSCLAFQKRHWTKSLFLWIKAARPIIQNSFIFDDRFGFVWCRNLSRHPNPMALHPFFSSNQDYPMTQNPAPQSSTISYRALKSVKTQSKACITITIEKECGPFSMVQQRQLHHGGLDHSSMFGLGCLCPCQEVQQLYVNNRVWVTPARKLS